MATNFKASGNNLTKLVHVVSHEAEIKIWVQIFWGLHSSNLRVHYSARFRTTLDNDREYLRNGLTYGKSEK